MRSLYFHATVGQPRDEVVNAVMAQTYNALRPLRQYVKQAIHTAKQRQFRYQLPWEPVRTQLRYKLDPQDTQLRIPHRIPSYIIRNWPTGQTPDLEKEAFHPKRGRAVRIEEAIPTVQGLRIHTSSPHLSTEESLLWCGVECQVEQEAESEPPKQLSRLDGTAIRVIGTPTKGEDGFWHLTVEGLIEDGSILVDGEAVHAQALPHHEGLQTVSDKQGRSFDVSEGVIYTEETPASALLTGNQGIRYKWKSTSKEAQSGVWIQLLPPETVDTEESMDPRAAFCEGDIREVWTEKNRRESSTYQVRKVDPDRFQLLLDRLPNRKDKLFLPVDLHNLYLQQRAIRQLINAPLPHHQGILRLCEDPQKANWPPCQTQPIATWYELTDLTRSGTDEQRAFVTKAVNTPDLAILEGPPGSGKTTAICELIRQLIAQNLRVMLCASTHVAIDNVLERLLESNAPLDAVRIGKIDKVDDNVQATQLDMRVDALLAQWNATQLAQVSESEQRLMAERIVMMAANLTCGTVMGIVNHPIFRDRDTGSQISERPITTMPHFDVLIIDEASKTLIQEFMVPALMAKRWIIVGDVRQLPPFADRADLVASLRDLVDEKDKPVFSREHQQACLLLFRLLDSRRRQVRWLIVEPTSVIDWLLYELPHRKEPTLSVVRIQRERRSEQQTERQRPGDPYVSVSVSEIEQGTPVALWLAAADWVLIEPELLHEVADRLPADLLLHREVCAAPISLSRQSSFLLRHAWSQSRAEPLKEPYNDRGYRGQQISSVRDCEACERDWFTRHDLAQELAWRITRQHELKHSHNAKQLEQIKRDLARLSPQVVDIRPQLDELHDIGLPSILEVLQEGIGAQRSKRQSALTCGLSQTRKDVFSQRFVSLSYQHRMHADISEYPRRMFYAGKSLQDANTIALRNLTLRWDFLPNAPRRQWINVSGREIHGENPDEVEAIEQRLRDFFVWVKQNGAPERKHPPIWEVACLCFYVKQERALSHMLQRLTKDNRKTRFRVQGLPIEVVCGTVDRFQGREADLVLLSMRNTRRIGFLDSPNRLNVAVTRARQQLFIVGNARYFERCGVHELEELAKQTATFRPMRAVHAARIPQP